MFNRTETKALVLKYLMQDIEAHEAGRYAEIGKGERDFLNEYDKLYDDENVEIELCFVVYEFWDRWRDARNHEWGYYPGVEENDWPIIARQIYQGIAEEWEPERMRDNFVFNPPPRAPRVSLWQRIKNHFDNK